MLGSDLGIVVRVCEDGERLETEMTQSQRVVGCSILCLDNNKTIGLDISD